MFEDLTEDQLYAMLRSPNQRHRIAAYHRLIELGHSAEHLAFYAFPNDIAADIAA